MSIFVRAKRWGALALTAAVTIGAACAVATPASASTRTFTLPSGARMVAGDNLRSPNGCFQLEMQSDGNLVVYVTSGHVPIWASHSDGHPGSYVDMQTDGNAVVYGQNRAAYFATNTDQHPGSYLQMQDDGNLVVYTPSRQPIFASHTDIGCGATVTMSRAKQILGKSRITLARVHVSGVVDNANARQNVVDLAAGKQAARSHYGTAPGGTTPVDNRLLSTLLSIEGRHSFSVSEIAGGSHTASSLHYRGRAVDINVVDGTHVTSSHRGAADVVSICKAGGASSAFIESGNHVHCQW